MQPIDLKEKHTTTALFQFIFPFSIQTDSVQNMHVFLQNQDFSPYFFNDSLEKGFQRFTKNIEKKGLLSTNHSKIPFHFQAVDIILAPFEQGFMTIKTTINQLLFSYALDFAKSFRMLSTEINNESSIEADGIVYNKIEDFLADCLSRDLLGIFADGIPSKKMFVQSLLVLGEEAIEVIDAYRSLQLSGLDDNGMSTAGANNLEYVSDFIQQHSSMRWAPNTYLCSDEKCFSCITNEGGDILNNQISLFYGDYYDILVINLFHKSLLLQIFADYSKLHIEQNKKEIKNLIYTINSFTSNYFFKQNPFYTPCMELFQMVRKGLQIDYLHSAMKEALNSLFIYDENTARKKDSLLLLMLTLYTIICGIFSMNLFTHDLEGKINWNHFKSYNPFEYFAVFIVLSGIIVVVTFTLQSIFQGLTERKNRKKHFQKTFIFSKNNNRS